MDNSTTTKTKTRLAKTDVITRVNSIVESVYGKRRRSVEIGFRTNQSEHVFATCPTRNDYWDFYSETRADLHDFCRLKTTEISDDIREFGSVVHVYVSVWSYGDWELDDVLTIWLGNDVDAPVLLSGGN